MNDAPHSPAPDERKGIAYAATAYTAWGVLPLYWRLLDNVPPVQITLHRVVWCAAFLAVVTLARGRLGRFFSILRTPRLLGVLLLTSVLISCNWTLFLYCVATHQLVEASLGYYITPFVSFALGIAFLHEQVSRVRVAAMVLAGGAVAAQSLALGHFPWIGPGLAISFGLYGYFRKLAPVEAIDGLGIETLVLFPFALAAIVMLAVTGGGAFPTANIRTDILLVATGPLTAFPLVFFAAGAQRIRLTTLGFLQYLAPTITLGLATIFLGEAFTRIDAIAFGCVWIALAIVSLEGRLRRLRARLS
jgi:chloramphenicol-sensitive protein RarD